MITYYYPRTLRSITVALLDLFNDMRVIKYDKYGNALFERQVPITWGPVEKYHLDRIENNYFDSSGIQHNIKYYTQLPRMALVLNGIVYDSRRAIGCNQWRSWFKNELEITDMNIDELVSDGNQIIDYQPTPYNYNFMLYIKTDSTDYLAQILENILPYFNPKLHLRVKEFSFLNIERDLPVSLDGVNPDFVSDMDEKDTKFVDASINLTVEGWSYRKFLYSKVIKYINTKYYNKINSNFIEGFSLSAVKTISGVPVLSGDIPSIGDYYISGNYLGNNKEFDWYQMYHTSSFGLT